MGGLISTYYIERMKHYYRAKKEKRVFSIAEFEEGWIRKDLELDDKPFADPLRSADEVVNKF